MKMIPPVVIDESKLVYSSLEEDDYDTWDPLHLYAAGDRVIRPNHQVYQRLLAGTSATEPENDAVNWKAAGPTNKYAMFDEATGSLSSAADTITVTVAPGMVDSLVLVDVTATTVTAYLTVGGVEKFRRVTKMIDHSNVYDAYTYFFAPILVKRTLVLMGIPPYADGLLTVVIEGSGDPVSVGTFVTGMTVYLGDTRTGLSLNGTDYTVKQKDAWGSTSIDERPEASRMTVPFVVKNTLLDYVMRTLHERRAKASVWIGVQKYDSGVVYGYPIDKQVLIPYDAVSECSVTIEELI